MLGARNSSQTDYFSLRVRHESLDVYYISQSSFALPRQSFRDNSDRIILFEQTLNIVESLYKDIGGCDMKYDEFEQIFRKAGCEKSIYVLIWLEIKKKVKL